MCTILLLLFYPRYKFLVLLELCTNFNFASDRVENFLIVPTFIKGWDGRVASLNIGDMIQYPPPWKYGHETNMAYLLLSIQNKFKL